MVFDRLSLTSPTRHGRRLVAALSLPVVMSLALVACGGDDKASPSTETPSDGTNTAGAVTLNGQWPLTGTPLEGDLPAHPVYAVKMDNTANSAPQVGLSSADLIVEELVEGGLTRLAVFYYQDVPDAIGPVRSMRASDIGIVKPVAANLVASGAANPTIQRLDEADIATFTEDDGGAGFYREGSRIAPYNLFSDLTKLAGEPGSSWAAPEQSYLPFGSPDDFAGDIPVQHIAATFSTGHTTSWEHSSKGWTRPDSFAESGDDFTADNVLLLRVKIGDAGYLDPAGNPVPETEFTGEGDGVLVHGDKAIRLTWSKKENGSQLVLTDKHGKVLTVPAGHTWIELVPEATGNVTLSK